MSYKLKCLQNSGLKEDYVFKSKEEIVENLKSFHNQDFDCEDCKDIYDHINKLGFDSVEKELEWLCEWGQWEVLEVNDIEK